jgi:hypothetical protein
MIAMLLSDDCDSYVIPLLNRACMLEVRGDVSSMASRSIRAVGEREHQVGNYPQRGFAGPLLDSLPLTRRGRVEALRHGQMIAKALQRWPTRRGGADSRGHA